ncbi:MAG: TolC family protein [Candidatus Schekmanbacteria bacterium]|nr:TolC family protein [Candidatus Schekmanbacteria bacterium]
MTILSKITRAFAAALVAAMLLPAGAVVTAGAEEPAAAASSLTPPAPLTLADAIALGLQQAPELRQAAAGADRVRAATGVVRSGALPQIAVSGDIRRAESFKTTSSLGIDENLFAATLSVTQTLYSFGRLTHALSAAAEEEAAAAVAITEARAAVTLRVAAAFAGVLLAKANHQVAAEAVSVSAALVERARLREETGVGTRFDVVRAAAELAGARARDVAATAAVGNAHQELAVAMGMEPGTDVAVAGDLFTLGTPVDVAAAEELALRHRPSLAALARRIRSSEALTRLAHAQGRPLIGAVASGSYAYHDYITASPFFSGNEALSAYAGVTVQLPLFDGFKVRETARQQLATTQSLQAERERARLDAIREVRQLHRELSSGKEALAARREGAAAAAEALRLAQVMFAVGRATSLDVVQASLTLATARNAEAEVAYAYQLALARLAHATGTDAVIQEGTQP